MSADEAAERAALIAASGSGGSAQGFPPQLIGTLRFGETVFGRIAGGTLYDDDGRVLVPRECGRTGCVGSHVWDDGGVRCYCAGPGV